MTQAPQDKPAPFVEIEVGGHQLRCEYDYTPGRPGVHTMPNGDPGYPDDPEEFVVSRISIFVGLTPTHPLSWLDITDLVVELTDEEGGIVGPLALEAFQLELDEAQADIPEPEVTDWSDLGDGYPADLAADAYQRELDRKASQ